MADPFNWQCPHCDRHVTIGSDNRSESLHTLSIPNALGRNTLATLFIVCPNGECQQPSLMSTLWTSEPGDERSAWRDRLVGSEPKERWRLIPFGSNRVFPDYIPLALRTDYVEACRIRDLSPKAAATLCRRCLQGMIRDFWKVDTRSNRLWDEMKAIKENVDPDTWDAIVALKDLGNIGAHMEMDVNAIVDVEPREAGLLIELIESLFEDWYIQREQRRRRNADLKAAVASKKT